MIQSEKFDNRKTGMLKKAYGHRQLNKWLLIQIEPHHLEMFGNCFSPLSFIIIDLREIKV
jgi:hypothetical protein